MSPTTVISHNFGPDEFRLRYERMINQQRQEASIVRHMMGDKKERLKYNQKEAVYDYVSSMRRTHEEQSNLSFSRDSTSNTSFNGPSLGRLTSQSNLPLNCQKALEAMSSELRDMNPAFTIRRHFQHAEEEM